MLTYDELAARLTRRFARADLAGDIQAFIELGEAEIVSKLRVRETETTATINPDGGQAALPSDFIAVGEIRRADRMDVALEYASPKRIYERDYRPFSNREGWWSMVGNKIVIRPTPEGVTWATSSGAAWATSDGTPWGALPDYWMRYYARPAALSSENQTNALFPQYSNIYFYAALAQGFEHTRNFESADRSRIAALELINQHNMNWIFEREGEGALQLEAPGTVV